MTDAVNIATIEGFYKEPKNTIDVMMIGACLLYTSMKNGDEDVAQMREEYNGRRRYVLHRFKEMGLKCFEPVSYTHLDVYKRQLCTCTRRH